MKAIVDARRRRYSRHLTGRGLDRYGVPFRLVRWSNTSFLGNELNLLLRKSSANSRMRIARIAAIVIHPMHELVSRMRRRVESVWSRL